MMDRYDIKGNVFLTQDLWKNPKYWDYFEEPFESGEYTREKLERDALKFYDNNISKLRGVATVKQIPSEIISLTPRTKARIENWSAAIIYVPAEVAESVFFSREKGVNLKIGHVEERVYDKYINGLMDVAHLRQPADLVSKRLEPKTVTPYIDKHRIVNQTRLFFNDTAKSIQERIQNIPAEEYSYTIDPKIGELLNPFMEKVIYAVESARILGKTPVKINNAELNEGRDVVKGFENGSFNMEQLKWEMPTLVEEYITKQFHY